MQGWRGFTAGELRKKAYKCGDLLGSSPREDQQAGSFGLG